MDRSNAVIVYAKWPEISRTKTRIAQDTSERFALDFSKACLDDLIQSLKKTDYYDLMVGVDTFDEIERFRVQYGLKGLLLGGNHSSDKKVAQSEKFDAVFRKLLSEYSKAILIPMDLPFLAETDMISSFTRLESNRFVLGPEFNGGIFLIGMKAPYTCNVFDGVSWSTGHSFQDLLQKVGPENAYTLPPKSDFNILQEVLNQKEMIQAHCPKINELLLREGYYRELKDTYINYDDLDINISTISAIVQKKIGDEYEILVQTRFKPTYDPKNTGKIEIPNGILNKRELAPVGACREVKEETGLTVNISDEFQVRQTTNETPSDQMVVAYQPFSITQQILGGRAYVTINFICDYNGGVLRENLLETRDPHWLKVGMVAHLLRNNPEKIFPLNIPVLKQYCRLRGEKV